MEIEILIEDSTYSRMMTVPETVSSPDELINFLLDFYFQNAELTKAQEILMEEDTFQIGRDENETERRIDEIIQKARFISNMPRQMALVSRDVVVKSAKEILQLANQIKERLK